ncbi:MAG: T9SS type A sorting domain-containing protein [Sphingobacteriales bacterium]|nr:T9SS type A sorting domain-containing protein [Sphingobacteriales bacterium]
MTILRFYLSFWLIVWLGNANAANELYLKGQTPAISSATPTLYNNGALIYVNGDITMQDALFVNTGGTTNGIELTGNWANNQPGGNNKYQSTGAERFSGTSDQTISGVMNGTAGNDNQFYNLYIDKSGSTGEYVSLLNDVHINASGLLTFENSNGIIRTQSASVGTSDITYTGNYSNYLYILNPSASAITGHSTGSGAVTRYIEGKLKRQVNAATIYFFPVGVNKSYLGGMNAFSLSFTSAPASTGILSYLEIGSQNLIDPDVFTDVAKVDNNPLSINYFSTCTGAPDGITDWARLTEKISHQWNITPDNATSYNYSITVFPSSNLEGSANYYSVPCSPNYKMQYIARNGIPGGNLATYQPAAGFQNELGYFMGPTGKTLPSQTSFSNYRLWGAVDANTLLPVELINFTLTILNNESFLLNWSTASEFNNLGFEVQRSTNAVDFETIGWIAGNGNSNHINSYSLEDKNVHAGVVYYYRLKQVDINNKFSYSPILEGKLYEVQGYLISDFFPNPTSDYSSLTIVSPEQTILILDVYDILGQVVVRMQRNISAGFNTLTYDLSALPNAAYVAEFKTANKVFTKKIIKR